MATLMIPPETLTFRADCYLTPEQQRILKEITNYTGKTIEEFFKELLETHLESDFASPDIMRALFRAIWQAEHAPLETDGRSRITLELNVPENKFDILTLIKKYIPAYFDESVRDDVRIILEAPIEEIPDDIRKRLAQEWLKTALE